MQPHTLEIMRPRKSFITHWPGVEITYYASTSINIFINFLQNKQSPDYLRPLQITKYLQLEATDSTKKIWDTRNRSTQIEPRRRFLLESG